MKRCWLHIGMHKTGSTAVQAFLTADNFPGWKYLTLRGSSNMGASMYAMFSMHAHRYHWFLKRGDTPEQVAHWGAKLRVELAAAIKACAEENFIISGESLSIIEREGIQALKDFLAPFFDEIRIIGYVRPPVGFKISFFQQRLKHSNCKLDFGDFRLRYFDRFNKFDEIFGREHVLLRKFAPATLENGCVVTDFCTQTGVPMPEGFAAARANESLCREACAILYAYRNFGPAYGIGPDVIKENKQILAPLLVMRGSRFQVSQSLVLPSLALEEKDVRWMEQRLGESLSEGMTEDGTEIAREEDLLIIDGASCRDYARKLGAMYQLEIPDDRIPVGERVDPQVVADFVEYCRGLCRRRIEDLRTRKPVRLPNEKKPKKPKQRKRPPLVRALRKCWRFLKKRVAPASTDDTSGPR